MPPAPYSRNSPSPRYRELLDQYLQMHVHGDRRAGRPASVTFDGRSLPTQIPRIALLVRHTGARTLIDYGCGKGVHHDDLRRACGGVEVTPYDPAYPPFAQLPGPTDGVICTDVLEHCPAEDMEWIVAELFTLARRFVFASVACTPAAKVLPNGENAHVTVRPTEYWVKVFDDAKERTGNRIPFEVWAQHRHHTDRIANFAPLQPQPPRQVTVRPKPR